MYYEGLVNYCFFFIILTITVVKEKSGVFDKYRQSVCVSFAPIAWKADKFSDNFPVFGYTLLLLLPLRDSIRIFWKGHTQHKISI